MHLNIYLYTNIYLYAYCYKDLTDLPYWFLNFFDHINIIICTK